MKPGSGQGGAGRLRFIDALLLAIPAVWACLNVPARNLVGIPHLERLVFVSFLVWAVTCLLAWAVVRRSGHRKAVVYGLFFLSAFLVSGGGLVRQWGAVETWLLTVLAVGLVVILTIRMPDSMLPAVVVATTAVFLISGPVLDLFESMIRFGSSEVEVTTDPIVFEDSGDVFLVVLDGFPGFQALSMDFDAEWPNQLREALQARGFNTPEFARASYPATDYSIPSLLAMGYPTSAAVTSDAALQDLYNIVSGDNPVRESFALSGYTTYMVESGWSGSSCRDWYDVCVPSPWLDDPMYQTARDSLLVDLLTPATGYSFVGDSLAVMGWLLDNAATVSGTSAPEFVFAHVLAPHPPFFLDRECQAVITEDRSGYFFERPGVPTRDRADFFEDQLLCMASFIVQLSDQVETNDTLVFVSDHGSDRRNQLFTDPATWTDDAIAERMNVLVAVRTPGDCPLPSEIHLPNVMRRVLSCLWGQNVADVENHQYLIGREWPAR